MIEMMDQGKNMTLTQERLKQVFNFDPTTGKFYWINPPKRHPDLLNKEAGCSNTGRHNKNYWVIKLDCKSYKRGHLVYFLTHGEWPKPCLDHINGNSLDDRPENLRKATITENNWNHKTRRRTINLPMGVRLNCSGNFSARISFHGKQIHLGVFDTAEQASNVYQIKRKELYDRFA